MASLRWIRRLPPPSAGDRLRLTDADHQLLTRLPPATDDSAGVGARGGRSECGGLCGVGSCCGTGRQPGAGAEFFSTKCSITWIRTAATCRRSRPKRSATNCRWDAGAPGLGWCGSTAPSWSNDVVPDGPGGRSRAFAIGDRNHCHRMARRCARHASTGPGAGDLLTGPGRHQPDACACAGWTATGAQPAADAGLRSAGNAFSAARDGNLLILRVTAFDGNTAERLSQALEAGMVAKPPPAAVVLDLRGNRGGLLRQAVTGVALLAEQGV